MALIKKKSPTVTRGLHRNIFGYEDHQYGVGLILVNLSCFLISTRTKYSRWVLSTGVQTPGDLRSFVVL